jgi:uncharacterized protein
MGALLQTQHGPLAGLELQRLIERRTVAMSGDSFTSPAQRVVDFLKGKVSSDLPPSSYRLGTTPAPLHDLYPPEVTVSLRKALRKFERKLKGITEGAVLHGAETRTSSPVTIIRTDTSCESVGLKGLFPCGEGAGYAGGIVSAAVDGIRVASALLLGKHKEAGTWVEDTVPSRQDTMY